MNGQILNIAFEGGSAYLTAGKPLTFAQLDLPSVAKSFKTPAYWTIRVVHYNFAEQSIFCEILSYQAGQIAFSGNQRALAAQLQQIEMVRFRSIDTNSLLLTLDSRKFKSTVPLIITHRPERQTWLPKDEPVVHAPVKRIYTETFCIAIKDVTFESGRVSMQHQFTGTRKNADVIISNDSIIKEFDAIKNYFANVLGTKKIEVTATVEIMGEQIDCVAAISADVQKIDATLVEQVKLDLLRAAKNRTDEYTDTCLLTKEEYFDKFVEHGISCETFYTDEQQFLDDLLKISDSKHYHHLRYLSARHCHRILKLRFIHQPFAFIFLLENKNHYFLAWETLHTAEATWLWQVEKNQAKLKDELQQIDAIIRDTKDNGKNGYIKIAGDNFFRVFHDYADEANGLQRWKKELEIIVL